MSRPKKYLLPTNKWLKPLSIIHNENNMVINSELINEIKKEKVIVKVTKRDTFLNNMTENIYKIINKSPHILSIYCFLIYNEKITNLDKEYKDVIGFCNRNKDDQIITLEIMKKYKGSLHSFEKQFDIATYQHILKYMLLIQMELFNLYGFIHKDIHLGNFLLDSNKVVKQTQYLFYIHNSIDPIKFQPIIKLVLTDFENSLILFRSLNPTINTFLQNKGNIIYDNTLESNIMNTFYWSLDLIKDDIIRNKFHKIIYSPEILEKAKRLSVKRLSSYARKEIDEEGIKHYMLSNCITIIQTLFGKLFEDNYHFYDI